MLNIKKITSLAITTALVASLAACGAKAPAAEGPKTEAPVKLVFSNVTSVSGKVAGEKFKEVVEKESNGTITVDLFPDNQLGDDRVVIETTQFGDIDIAVSSTSPIASMYADFYLFDAPFLFLDKAAAYKGLDGEVGQKILDGMSAKGLKGLAFWENGFRNFTNNDIPVSKPADVAKMKIRTMENEVHIAAWKAFGANPTPMAFTELFTALQQKTVNGQENPLGIIDANKFQEVQQYVSLTQHVYTPYIVTMNLEKYNSLSDKQKAAIDKAAEESTKLQREKSQEFETTILKNFATQGVKVIELTQEEKEAFQKIVTDAKVFDLVRQKMDNPEYLDEILGN
jgi:tripartite ATP-independent transporter DctP family solute receptor